MNGKKRVPIPEDIKRRLLLYTRLDMNAAFVTAKLVGNARPIFTISMEIQAIIE